MAHTAPPAPSRRWLELGFGFVLLLVGALVAVVAVLALNHPHGQQAASAAEPPRSSTAPASKHPSSPTGRSSESAASAAPPAATGKLPLVVLNNTSDTPASVAADRFRQQGWSVTDTSTFEGDILSTAAYFDPDVPGAETAATELQREFPAIQRVKPKFDGLPDGPIVVILTSDYS